MNLRSNMRVVNIANGGKSRNKNEIMLDEINQPPYR